MDSLKQLKAREKLHVQQRQIVLELNALVKDIDRCERTINELKQELLEITEKFKNRITTREDVDYLSELLRCAKKKLAWEKNMASLQKRAPGLLEQMTSILNDPNADENDPMRPEIAKALNGVQKAMERLQEAKVT